MVFGSIRGLAVLVVISAIINTMFLCPAAVGEAEPMADPDSTPEPPDSGPENDLPAYVPEAILFATFGLVGITIGLVALVVLRIRQLDRDSGQFERAMENPLGVMIEQFFQLATTELFVVTVSATATGVLGIVLYNTYTIEAQIDDE